MKITVNKYFFEGMSLTEYCRKESLSYTSITAYIRNYGLSVEDAIIRFRNTEKYRKETREKIKKSGLKPATYFQRIRNGTPLDKPVIKGWRKNILKDGRMLKDVVSASVYNFILFKRRVLKISLDKAYELWTEGKLAKEQIKYYYGSEPLTVVCKKIGIPSVTVIYRFKHCNETIEQAVKNVCERKGIKCQQPR